MDWPRHDSSQIQWEKFWNEIYGSLVSESSRIFKIYSKCKWETLLCKAEWIFFVLQYLVFPRKTESTAIIGMILKMENRRNVSAIGCELMRKSINPVKHKRGRGKLLILFVIHWIERTKKSEKRKEKKQRGIVFFERKTKMWLKEERRERKGSMKISYLLPPPSTPPLPFISRHHFFDEIKCVCGRKNFIQLFFHLPWHTKEEGVSEGWIRAVMMMTFFLRQKSSFVWPDVEDSKEEDSRGEDDSSLLVTYFDPLDDIVTSSSGRFCCLS